MKKQITFQAQQSEEASIIAYSVLVIVACDYVLTKRRSMIEALIAIQVFGVPIRTGDNVDLRLNDTSDIEPR